MVEKLVTSKENYQPTSASNDYIIEMRNITKVFPGVIANDNVSLTLKRGEIHALLGENGAGKSTLMSVLFGLYQPEEGEIYKDGQLVQINDPNDANDLGIGMVHQHFKLVDTFTVLDNIILGDEPLKNGVINRKEARKKLIELSKAYGLEVDPDAIIEDVTIGMQQRTEILKMLYRENDILIFDEPTAVLTPQEITELMGIMRGLADEGKSLLFITHKLNEIMAIADRVTVLRKGKYIGTVDVKDSTVEDLSRMMVGRDVSLDIEKSDPILGKIVLDVQDLVIKNRYTGKEVVNNLSLSVREGEIVGIAGIDGNGQSELAMAINGLIPVDSGRIILNGIDVTKKSIRFRNEHGLAHVPEDRHKFGLVLDFPLSYNLALKQMHEPRFKRMGFIREKNITTYGNELIEKFDIRAGQGGMTKTRSMSGGNQQKAIIAREASTDTNVLLAVQLVRGLDVGAIEYIHNEIVRQRDFGKAVLMISLELDEIMTMSDRILVMYEGEIVAELDPKKTTVEEIGIYMAGGRKDRPTLDNIRPVYEKTKSALPAYDEIYDEEEVKTPKGRIEVNVNFKSKQTSNVYKSLKNALRDIPVTNKKGGKNHE